MNIGEGVCGRGSGDDGQGEVEDAPLAGTTAGGADADDDDDDVAAGLAALSL